MSSSTPMMQQYFKIKAEHAHVLLFFRMGDFYEMFLEDAVIAAPLLDVALTKRGKDQEADILMCGVPVQSIDTYIKRLIDKGHRVALCEQLETPQEYKKRGGKGPLRRDVTRIFTPGTLTEESLLPSRQSNYLACLTVLIHSDEVAMSYMEVSTGAFFTQKENTSTLLESLYRIDPAEILVPDVLKDDPSFIDVYRYFGAKMTFLPLVKFNELNADIFLKKVYGVLVLDSFPNLNFLQKCSIAALLDYLFLTQRDALKHIKPLKSQDTEKFLVLDASTRKSLELTQSLSGTYEGSLLESIDRTQTSLGARLLRSYISMPLCDEVEINRRLDHIAYFVENQEICDAFRVLLKSCADMERSLTRIILKRGSPRDLGVLRSVMGYIRTLRCDPLFKDWRESPLLLSECIRVSERTEDLFTLLESALNDTLGASSREGGYVRSGFSEELDTLRSLGADASKVMKALEEHYSRESGITTLRIRFNNIIGYHIEVPLSQKGKVLASFIHRQTLSNHHRYVTKELVETADKIQTASERAISLEISFFEAFVKSVQDSQEVLYSMADLIARLDVSSSLATLSRKGYTRPLFSKEPILSIEGGRHPVVERFLEREGAHFVPNDLTLTVNQRFLLMTGPNMAGKSTFLRQNAIIIVMSQMGCFVPAQLCHMGIVDRIFSRVGASDDLASGRSTFMVEMVETATILNQSTDRSFVILDEIGRGTATYDGLAVAYAVLETLYLHNRCRCLFATHYHELISMTRNVFSIGYLTMKIQEWHEKIIFLHEVIEGVADRSYGLHVAQMAGFPSSVIEKARLTLESLNQECIRSKVPLVMGNANQNERRMRLMDDLLSCDLNEMTPKKAWDLVYALKAEWKNQTDVA